MILEDQEINLTKVFAIVGVVIFISSLIYISILTSKLISLRKVIFDNKAKERIQKQMLFTPTPPPYEYK